MVLRDSCDSSVMSAQRSNRLPKNLEDSRHVSNSRVEIGVAAEEDQVREGLSGETVGEDRPGKRDVWAHNRYVEAKASRRCADAVILSGCRY